MRSKPDGGHTAKFNKNSILQNKRKNEVIENWGQQYDGDSDYEFDLLASKSGNASFSGWNNSGSRGPLWRQRLV